MARQGSLFEPAHGPGADHLSGAPAPPGRQTRASATIAPAEPPPTLAALAQRLPARLHLGTSSWSFPGWAGLVYADAASEAVLARRGLPAYVAHPLFRAVGIDRTFYAPIDADAFAAYARQIGPDRADFACLIKAPMMLTAVRLRDESGRWCDNDAFLDARLARTQFVEPALAGLGTLCGPLVFQFPPLPMSLRRNPLAFADRLAEFLLALPRLPTGFPHACYAVELRDPDLLTDDYLAALCAGGATHCLAIHARMPALADQLRYWREASASPLVIRWSLHSGLRYEEAKERYAPFDRIVDEDPDGRAAISEAVFAAVARGQSAVVIVNNKAEGSAPQSIVRLAQLIADHGATIVAPGR